MSVDAIKQVGHELGAKYDDRYGASLVDEHVQLSLGVWLMQRDAAIDFDPIATIATSAFIAGSNKDNREARSIAATLLRDEELGADILSAAAGLGLIDTNSGTDKG